MIAANDINYLMLKTLLNMLKRMLKCLHKNDIQYKDI